VVPEHGTRDQELPPLLLRAMSGAAGLRQVTNNLFAAASIGIDESQLQTGEAFSRKWDGVRHGSSEYSQVEKYQKDWFLKLYGFSNEADLAEFLARSEFIIDCGCGLGYKSAWFADLSPQSTIIGIDYSDSVEAAAAFYGPKHRNLFFIRGDIGAMPYFDGSTFAFVCCDQVIMHTAEPRQTFSELVRITTSGGQIACYVYRRKALPRELLDTYFRDNASRYSHEEMIQLSGQLTTLGRLLSQHTEELEFPSIPMLDIDGGRMTVQRFIYWHFIKCFWNESLGEYVSMLTNYDWYAPAQAARYTEEEFRSWIVGESLDTIVFHVEPPCFSGRFRKT
jgi:SAM-dependent methyltransferase